MTKYEEFMNIRSKQKEQNAKYQEFLNIKNGVKAEQSNNILSPIINKAKEIFPENTAQNINQIAQQSKQPTPAMERANNKVLDMIKSGSLSNMTKDETIKSIANTKAQYEAQKNMPVTQKITNAVKQPVNNAISNATLGALTEQENVAWSEYRSKQDEASKAKALDATKAREQFYLNDKNVGKGNWVTKDFAQYLPQMANQLKYGGIGAGVGAGTGATGAAIVGQLGPQVGLPEEIITVPAAALLGAKTGYVAGSAKYGYDTMSGAAYKNLLDLGVPNEIALELSGDEALINSLIEGGGAITDLITLGLGKLVKKGASPVAKTGIKKLLSAAGAYGLNLGSEYGEEYLQEGVTIGTEKKAMQQAGLLRNVTPEQDKARQQEAGMGGLKIAAVGGFGNVAGNVAVNTIANRKAPQMPLQPIQNTQPQIIPPVAEKPVIPQPDVKQNIPVNARQVFTTPNLSIQNGKTTILPTAINKADEHIDNRTKESIKNRNLPAFQSQVPEIKPIYKNLATSMLDDLKNNTVKGERWVKGNGEWDGTKRVTTPEIENLLDDGMPYQKIEKGLEDIILDDGRENNTVSKRIEFELDDMATNGFKKDGMAISPNQKYINIKNKLEGANPQIEQDKIDLGDIGFGEYAPQPKQNNIFKNKIVEKPLALPEAKMYVTPQGQVMSPENFGKFEQGKLPTALTKTTYETAKKVKMDVKSMNKVMTMSEKLKRPISIFENADSNGYDGMILNDANRDGESTSYIAFSPNQIKNVDNLNPTSSDDIRYSLEGDKANSKQSKVLENIAPISEQNLDKLEEEPKVAKVLTQAPKRTLPNKWENAKDIFARKVIDTGNTINTVGKIVNDDVLYPLFNNAKQGRQAAETMIGEEQRNLAGERVGNSLIGIFEPIKKKGEDYTSSFYEYLLHKHNVERMAQNKPVFGKTVTAEDSERISAQLLKLHPEFEQLANKVYVYNRNLMQYRVDSGLVSQESADMMNKMYPHYVPTFRDKTGTAGAKVVKNDVAIANTVRKATGGDSDILPLDLSMARQTMQTIQAAKRNILGNRLLNDTLNNRSAVAPYITAIQKSNEQIDIDSDTDIGIDENTNTFRIFRNGQTVSMKVNNGIFEGIKSISSEKDPTDLMKVVKLASKPVNLFKQLVTGKNPIFIPRNFFRDIQDVPLYSKNLREFVKNYPTVFKDMATDSELWRLYKSLGGTGSSFFDYEKGIDKQINKGLGTKISDNTLGRVEQLNMMIEQAPRFAEFKSTIEKAGNRDYDTLMKALLNAADITVNFGRSGSITKIANQTVVPFLNPSIQGTDKIIRAIREGKANKQILKLVTKATLFGMLPSVINELLYGDDDDYEKLTDRDKDINFLIKTGDNEWLRIPKGRVISMVGNLANRGIRLAKGEEVDWNQFFDTLLQQTAPISPFESDITAPVRAVKNNKSWYGSDIVPQRLEGYAPKDQYDEKTDKFSKWLGGVLNYSPKKINYLIDAYSGVIGDFALPMMTPQAEVNPFVKAFTIDGEYSNEISDKFYKAKEKYDKKQNPKLSAQAVTRYLNKQNTMANDLYGEIRNIQGGNLTDKEKKEKARELRELINLIQITALTNVKDYEKAVDKYINKFPNDLDKSTDYAYLYANRDLFGAEYALKVYNKDIYKKAQNYGDFESYFNAYFRTKFQEEPEEKEKVAPKLPTINDIPKRKE